jgi:hypothetical protein
MCYEPVVRERFQLHLVHCFGCRDTLTKCQLCQTQVIVCRQGTHLEDCLQDFWFNDNKDRPIEFRQYPTAQSCRGRPDFVSFASQAFNSCGLDQWGKMCFRRMLEKEATLCGDNYVFYHSYSHIALVYEIQCSVAKVLYQLRPTLAPLPRILKAPFKATTLEEMRKKCPGLNGRDTHASFRALFLSANSTIFNSACSDAEAHPIQSWAQGYSCTYDFSGIMSNLLEACGLVGKELTDVTDQVMLLGLEYGLPMTCFPNAARLKPQTKTITPVHSRDRQNVDYSGHFLQIFVNKKVIDEVAYGCLAWGPTDTKRHPLSRGLQEQKVVDGQVRIWVEPGLIIDPEKVQIFHYSANRRFATRRPEFQRRLVAALEPIFRNQSTLNRALKGVEGHKKSI